MIGPPPQLSKHIKPIQRVKKIRDSCNAVRCPHGNDPNNCYNCTLIEESTGGGCGKAWQVH